jgi:diacylglycerol kinase
MEDIRKNKKITFKRFINICSFIFQIFIKPDPINGILLFISETIVRITGIINTFIIAKIIDVVVNTIQNNGTVQAVIPYIIVLVSFDFLAKFLSGFR